MKSSKMIQIIINLFEIKKKIIKLKNLNKYKKSIIYWSRKKKFENMQLFQEVQIKIRIWNCKSIIFGSSGKSSMNKN